jgi:hypothetical protein
VSQLLSKIVAGGLSAAVILIWWPRFFPVDTVETWLARGVVWTLSFELLLHALAPLEESLWRSCAARRVRSRAAAARARVAGDNPKLGFRFRGVLACTALAVPVALLASAPAPPPDDAAVKPVKHVTQVKRVVRVERPDAGLSDAPAAAPEAPAVGPDPGTAATSTGAPVRASTPAGPQRASKPSVRRPSRAPQQAPAEPDGGGEAPSEVDTRSPAPGASAEPQPEPDASGASPRRFAG